VFRSAFVSEGLGKSLKSLGPANRAASREAFQRAARQFQGLAEKYPKNAQVKQNLSVCYYLLSTASDAEEAKLALQKALATAEELQREHKLPEESARLPDFLRLELAKVH
jgi:methionine synthase I (cobalamin-dependent)